MSGGAVIGIVVVVVVIALIVALVFAMRARQRQRQRLRLRLQQRFGPEYERTVERADSRRAAEQELAAREERHAELDIRPLAPEARDRYAREWTLVQEHFVDAPESAVTEADQLVVALMGDRGYPTEGYRDQLEHLSVEHANTLDHYRAAHDVSERQRRHEASTEDLRQAMVHYRALFEDLLSHADTRDNGYRDNQAHRVE